MPSKLLRQTPEDLGRLVLRLGVGGLMLLHGVHKVFHGINGVRGLVAKQGLPELFAFGVYAGEVVAPILILVGWMSRPAALVLAFNMVVAIALSHTKDLMRIGAKGEWPVELQVLYMLGALAIALLGPGRWSVSKGKTRLG